jgi:hypothetical protein
MEERHFKASPFQPDNHTGAGLSLWHHIPVVVVPDVLPDGMPAHHSSRRLVDSCSQDNRWLVQNASAPDNGAVQNNNNRVEMALYVLFVQVSRAVLAVEHPVLMQDCPVAAAWPPFRQLVD